MSRSHLIRHPGPPTVPRRHVVSGFAEPLSFSLGKGAMLMSAIAEVMDAAGCDSAVVRLDGLVMGPYKFVMPDTSPDEEHVAWYSQTHDGQGATLTQGTAIVGRRNGEWFLHCHAIWDDPQHGRRAGHLLPDQVTIGADYSGDGFRFEGGCFDVTADAETNFSFFRPRKLRDTPAVNAAIVSLAPHEDLSTAVAELSGELELGNALVLGIGSLIGADFSDGSSMESPISEVLLLNGARNAGPQGPVLPTFCVDPDGNFFEGNIVPGKAPICVTFEMILVAG
ncbi:PPC domain-containing DNA-binding protein [Roseibium marinum]|uniref:DUF296 domain-containing protein n=1 Tax=Roseibium marinum TaxID=281252 RepID=A0A2S3V0R1_9HYPH|nr:hypothetical protein [Roseibium marinum]POF33562.1 hypothetical protein CLV41_10110 [Roseibium marinum]